MSLVHFALRLLPPETAHDLAKWGMRRRLSAPGPFTSVDLETWFSGYRLMNPLGLAAGFDKNGELVDSVADYGFGFVEVGSVTWHGGAGNEKPRMFRIEGDDILNRMGLNGDPAIVVAERLKKVKNRHYGVNIAKTHSPKIMGDAAIRDIVSSFHALRSFGMYTTLNISCPNTAEGKTFEVPSALNELLFDIYLQKPERSVFVKLSPLIPREILESIVELCMDFHIDGFVCCNTYKLDHPRYGVAGASGSWVRTGALRTVRAIREMVPDAKIIACGGIATGYDIACFEEAGANVFQAYNGFVRGPNSGPRFASRVLQHYAGMKKNMMEAE